QTQPVLCARRLQRQWPVLDSQQPRPLVLTVRAVPQGKFRGNYPILSCRAPIATRSHPSCPLPAPVAHYPHSSLARLRPTAVRRYIKTPPTITPASAVSPQATEGLPASMPAATSDFCAGATVCFGTRFCTSLFKS